MEDDVQPQEVSNENAESPTVAEAAPVAAPTKSVAEMLAAAKQAVADQEAARLEATKSEAPEPTRKIDISTPEIVKIERKPREPRPQGAAPAQGRREDRPPKGTGGGPGGGGREQREGRGPQGGGERREGQERGERRPGGEHRGPGGGDRREGGRPGGSRPFDSFGEIELEKLVSDSLYLDNQAHAVVARMRDMDSGTKSQLRRLYNAVRRAVRAPESERQHHFVMLRARLAYTIARHSLRSLDALERLLLQVTRRNDARGYERFKDLFEAIVAYNE
jgi:CRISPR type III-A-associated protein Csm2